MQGRERKGKERNHSLTRDLLGSDFDRPAPGQSAFEHLIAIDQNGFDIAIANLYNAGVEVVRGIVTDWDTRFQQGVAPDNYIGDIFGSLGGYPDFGLGSITNGKPVDAKSIPRLRVVSRKAQRRT